MNVKQHFQMDLKRSLAHAMGLTIQQRTILFPALTRLATGIHVYQMRLVEPIAFILVEGYRKHLSICRLRS